MQLGIEHWLQRKQALVHRNINLHVQTGPNGMDSARVCVQQQMGYHRHKQLHT